MTQLEPFEPFETIRKVWDEKTDEWWYAIVDVIEILTESDNPRKYWTAMKNRKGDLIELDTICIQFPMKHKKNNRTYQTDCSNQAGLLRIIQSIPSPEAEPFKRWLAMTGSRRLDEIKADPLELEREKYRLQGYDEEWINARLNSKTVRNELTDEWQKRQVKGREYGVLTNEIHSGTFDGLSVKQHKDLKGVEKGNLRDHMTPFELAFTILGEAATTEIVRGEDAQGFDENLDAARRGGESAGDARKTFEESFGQKVISNRSYLEERKRLASGRTIPEEQIAELQGQVAAVAAALGGEEGHFQTVTTELHRRFGMRSYETILIDEMDPISRFLHDWHDSLTDDDVPF